MTAPSPIVAQLSVVPLEDDSAELVVAAGVAEFDDLAGIGRITGVEMERAVFQDGDLTVAAVQARFAKLLPHIAELLGRL